MRSTIVLLLFIYGCASPQFVGTSPGELNTKIRVTTTSPALRIVTFDDKHATVSSRPFYISPGPHTLTASYNSGFEQSLEDSKGAFSASSGQSVFLCKASVINYLSGKGKWTLIPIVGPNDASVHDVKLGDQEPTCGLWADVAEQLDDWVQIHIDAGASKSFRNAKGQSILEFAKERPSKRIVEILLKAGYN